MKKSEIENLIFFSWTIKIPGKGLTSWLSFVVPICYFHFPIGIQGHAWYLIVSIPDLCTLTFFAILLCTHSICFG